MKLHITTEISNTISIQQYFTREIQHQKKSLSLLLVIVRTQQILLSKIPPLERNTQCVPYERVSQYSIYSYGLNVEIYKLKDEQ